MPYWQLFYHIVWATKQRNPLISPGLEGHIYRLIRIKAEALHTRIFALNGMADHVHLVCAIPPAIAVSDLIGQVKGVSSAAVNAQALSESPFYWQDEYSVFSFDGKRLPNYIGYVQRQKEHHANGTIIPVLERIEPAYRVREENAIYASEDAHWREELFALMPE